MNKQTLSKWNVLGLLQRAVSSTIITNTNTSSVEVLFLFCAPPSAYISGPALADLVLSMRRLPLTIVVLPAIPPPSTEFHQRTGKTHQYLRSSPLYSWLLCSSEYNFPFFFLCIALAVRALFFEQSFFFHFPPTLSMLLILQFYRISWVFEFKSKCPPPPLS